MTLLLEESPSWRRLASTNSRLLIEVREAAATLRGATEPERFKALADAWEMLDLVERRETLDALECAATKRSPSDKDVRDLRLEVPADSLSPCRPDLTLHWPTSGGRSYVFAAINAKARTVAHVNAPIVSSGFGAGTPPPEVPTWRYKDGTLRCCQWDVYRYSSRAYPGRWDRDDATHYVLLTPERRYEHAGWRSADLETVMEVLLQAHCNTTRDELRKAIAAHIALPGSYPYRAVHMSGRLRRARRLGVGWSWATWDRHLLRIEHVERKSALVMGDKGWTLVDEGGAMLGPGTVGWDPQEASEWAADLGAFGDRAGWVPCYYPGCGDPSTCTTHVDTLGSFRVTDRSHRRCLATTTEHGVRKIPNGVLPIDIKHVPNLS